MKDNEYTGETALQCFLIVCLVGIITSVNGALGDMGPIPSPDDTLFDSIWGIVFYVAAAIGNAISFFIMVFNLKNTEVLAHRIMKWANEE